MALPRFSLLRARLGQARRVLPGELDQWKYYATMGKISRRPWPVLDSGVETRTKQLSALPHGLEKDDRHAQCSPMQPNVAGRLRLVQPRW